eukprot:3450566-Rhodomonas_salina.1
MQPARTEESEDWGAAQVGTFKDKLTEILEALKKQLGTIPEQPTRQIRKQVRELETRTGMDLGMEPTDVVPENPNTTVLNTTNTPIWDWKLRQHYSEWTNGVQIPLTAEIDSLKDQQLG